MIVVLLIIIVVILLSVYGHGDKKSIIKSDIGTFVSDRIADIKENKVKSIDTKTEIEIDKETVKNTAINRKKTDISKLYGGPSGSSFMSYSVPSKFGNKIKARKPKHSSNVKFNDYKLERVYDKESGYILGNDTIKKV